LRPTPVAAVPPAAAAAATAAAKPKARMPSLFERVTGASRLLQRDTPAPRPTAAPTAPRLAPLDPAERLAPSKEEDLLDIPAFLRRQAN
jgi:cell division protein FtsZ